MAKAAPREELAAVVAGDAGGFLPAMLQGVQPQRGRCRSIGCVDRAEDTAFLAQLVAIEVEKRMS